MTTTTFMDMRRAAPHNHDPGRPMLRNAETEGAPPSMTHTTPTITVSVEALEAFVKDSMRWSQRAYAGAYALLDGTGIELVPNQPLPPVELPPDVADLSMWRQRRGGVA